MEIKKTALHSLHQKYGAKFVSFADYEMPIQYPSGIIAEHKTTREEVGIFDVSHMGQLFIKGNKELTEDLEYNTLAEILGEKFKEWYKGATLKSEEN